MANNIRRAQSRKQLQREIDKKIIELYLEKMKRTIPLATSPKMPMIETINPMTTNAFAGKFSMRISCSWLQNGSSSSPSSSKVDSLGWIPLVFRSRTCTSQSTAASIISFSASPTLRSLLKFIATTTVTFEATVFDATRAQTALASSSSIPTYRSNSIDFDVRQRSAVQHMKIMRPVLHETTIKKRLCNADCVLRKCRVDSIRRNRRILFLFFFSPSQDRSSFQFLPVSSTTAEPSGNGACHQNNQIRRQQLLNKLEISQWRLDSRFKKRKCSVYSS